MTDTLSLRNRVSQPDKLFPIPDIFPVDLKENLLDDASIKSGAAVMTRPDPIAETLALDIRIAELMHRWATPEEREEQEREAAAEDAREDAREIAAIERQEQIDADELADAQDAGDRDRHGSFIPYSRYP